MNLYWIPEAQKAPLAFGPRPQADELLAWIDGLRQHSVDHVVSFITDEETARYGLAGESHSLQRHDIGFTHFPVDDFNTPDATHFDVLIHQLDGLREQGKILLLHCAGGIGRSGTTACCLLICEGHSPDDAIQLLSHARGCPVPESEDQFDFVRAFTPQSLR